MMNTEKTPHATTNKQRYIIQNRKRAEEDVVPRGMNWGIAPNGLALLNEWHQIGAPPGALERAKRAELG